MFQGDARRLPLRDSSVDVAFCSLTLHHFQPEEAIQVLRELSRASRVGIVVSDLYRSRAAYVAVWLSTRVFGRHAMTRHDGPLSVLRAYTPVELQRLALAAGLRSPQVRAGNWFRMMLVARRDV
jgi:hypothetical protein